MMRQVVGRFLCMLLLACAAGSWQGRAQCRFLPIDSLPLPWKQPALTYPLQGNLACRQWVDSVMGRMSLKERIGQLFVYTIAPQTHAANKALLRRVVREYKVGGLLFAGGQTADQVTLTNEAQGMAEVPLLITFDGEWGLAMRLKGTLSFPRNIVLGCITHDSLLYEYGREVARQCREIGVQVNFAPVADVNINPENPVINTRSFGENPLEVARKVVAYSRGLEAGRVLSVSKHFPGHGDTNVDSHKALPRLDFTRERLDSVELVPFCRAIRAGLGGIMVGHLEVPALEPQSGVPASLSKKVVTDLLADELGFRGMTFTDALAMRGVSGQQGSVCLKALQAGHDMLLVPRSLSGELDAVWAAVRRGDLPEEEINRRCRKVLTFKYALGLTHKPHVRLSGLEQRLNTPHARDLLRQLKWSAITVAGQGRRLLPLGDTSGEVAVLHVGLPSKVQPFLDELSRTVSPVSVQLPAQLSEAAGRALQKRLAGYGRLVVCVTDRKLSAYRAFFTRYLPDVPVVYVLFISGQQVPRRLGPAPDVLVLAHEAGEEVQRRAAAILTGKAGADGRLSAAVGDWFPAGAGFTLEAAVGPYRSLEENGVDASRLAAIDEIAEEGIRQGAYPGCQVAVLKDGQEIYCKAFGTHRGTGAQDARVSVTDVYDIASLTKTSATLLAVMKLYDKGRLSLTDRVSDYLPFLMDTDKRDITVRQLLLHESGLPSTLLFYREAIDVDSYEGALFRGRQDASHTARIGSRTWANPDFLYRAGMTSPVQTDSCTWQLADSLWLNPAFKQVYLQQIAEAPLLSRRYRYSCVGFILLQQLVEARAGMPMDEFLDREFYRPMGLTHTCFRPLQRLPRRVVVPSSVDPFLRKDTLQGFVHDESAAFQGGVSGNAGLFSNAREQALLYQMLLNGGELNGRRYLSEETCRVFTTTGSRISRRGLGFDKPDKRRPQRSPCCPEAPSSVYGHTGFTGTCAWVDPDNRLVYVFLSNRIFPQVWNNKLSRLDIRTRIQQAVYKALR